MIKDVKVIPGCISCRTCENVCPSVFEVNPKSKVITNDFEGKESEILQAELMCPVNVIKVDKEGGVSVSFKKAKLIEKKYLTPDTLELKFKTNNFKFKPGQYISLQAKDHLGSFSRSYSIASGNKNNFTLNVKLEKKGRGSTFFKKLKDGKEITFLGALGSFYLKNTPNRKVMIATGTGLAPMVAMLEKLPEETQKVIIFGVRYEKDVYYKEKLESFPNTKVIIKVSRPEKDYLENKGRVTDELDIIDKNDEIYICGNPAMVNSVKNILDEKGHDKKLINNESFTISRVFPGKIKDIFVNGNIPHINKFSWAVILFSIIFVPLSWAYNRIESNLYGDFLFMNNYMGFMYDLSWWAVVFVMAIRPISDLFPKVGLFKKLVTLRKPIGILSASVIVTNFIGSSIYNPNKIMTYFTIAGWSLYMPLVTKLSEITATILLLTSNRFSQEKLGKWWKKIQRSSYIYFITGGIVAGMSFPWKVYPALIIVIILWFSALIKNKLQNKKS